MPNRDARRTLSELMRSLKPTLFATEFGVWWVEATLSGKSDTVEWSPDWGFGIYEREEVSYFERPHKVNGTIAEVCKFFGDKLL